MGRRWLIVKSVLAAAIVAGVGWQFAKILAQPEMAQANFAVEWPWLLPAGLLYLMAHTLWGTFWWLLVRQQGVNISWRDGVRAYFVSQFGKYVPGKVFVIGIRVGLLRGMAAWPVVVYTATCETLTNMAAGALIAAALFPLVQPEELAWYKWLAVGLIAAAPLGFGLLSRLFERIAKKHAGGETLRVPSPGLMLFGLGQACVGWCLLSLSLLCVLAALAPDFATTSMFAPGLQAVAAGYVLGFIVLVSPGGLGVREALLAAMLVARFRATHEEHVAEGFAVVVALALRLVWTAFEVALAGALIPKRRGTDAA